MLGLIQRLHLIDKIPSQKEIIESNKDLFQGLGKFEGVKYEIKLKPGNIPIVRPPRRVPISIKDKLKQTLDSMVKDQIIEKINYPKNWCSNMVVLEKPNKELRICIDPVDLNQHLVREFHLIPTIEEIKSRLSGKKVFSLVDLKQGFYQIPLHPKSTDLCTFSTPFGYYKYLRLPFGISTAPEVFFKITQKSFEDIENVLVYFDDILIATEDETSHVKTLNQVLQRARELNIRLNEEKFKYLKTEIKYLGFEFSADGCKIDQERIEAIQVLTPPTNVKQLQSVLGMFNFLREFIPTMAEITAPLRILLRKNIDWHWTSVQQEAFEKLKSIVSTTPVLKHFDSRQDVTIQCDASQNGLGACLLQNKQKNINTLISNRLVKMRLALLQYDLEVTYLPGRQMLVADLLSRNYIQRAYDNEIQIKGYVHNLNAVELSLSNELMVSEDGLLYYNNRVVIPEALKSSALKSLHSGHMGVQKTILRAQETMYWINIQNDIESYIKRYLGKVHNNLKSNMKQSQVTKTVL
ncbi:uncharacterized protein K02A2.6-like [Diaphorina citri]|uniref:RNA-directed DNA polymerase n=1 Tax=Diaphorina citri TaxID=121845 RepID=A0A1S4ER27_DIACI|nr:uncharacterized protein K02A2.6-like [Diaphorina citri]